MRPLSFPLEDSPMEGYENGTRNTRRRRTLFQPSTGARLTFQELSSRAPRDVPVEEYTPEIHRAVVNPSNAQVVPAGNYAPKDLPPIYLLRETNAKQAYALVEHKKSIVIDHRGPGWGEVLFAVVYERIGDSNVFQGPSSQENAKMVAIKRLNKRRVEEYMQKGGEENPYKEIARMKEIGDNIHILRHVEALQDDDFLYIVTPKACDQGTLVDVIQWGSTETIEPSRARSIFRKILKILQYLEEKGYCHLDVSPDNFLFLTPDNLVAFDLALSLPLPKDESGRRVLSTPQGNFGTAAYMPPERYQNRVFCGVFADLWSAAVILYNLLTNQVLYRLPGPTDISFCFNLLARGLSSTEPNERAMQVAMLQEISQRPDGLNLQMELFTRAVAHMNLSPDAKELLQNLLQVSPSDRWTLAQAMESAYVQSDDD